MLCDGFHWNQNFPLRIPQQNIRIFVRCISTVYIFLLFVFSPFLSFDFWSLCLWIFMALVYAPLIQSKCIRVFFCIYWCLENSKSASYISLIHKDFWEFPQNGLCFESIRIHSFGENNYNTNGILWIILDFYVRETQASRIKKGKLIKW